MGIKKGYTVSRVIVLPAIAVSDVHKKDSSLIAMQLNSNSLDEGGGNRLWHCKKKSTITGSVAYYKTFASDRAEDTVVALNGLSGKSSGRTGNKFREEKPYYRYYSGQKKMANQFPGATVKIKGNKQLLPKPIATANSL